MVNIIQLRCKRRFYLQAILVPPADDVDSIVWIGCEVIQTREQNRRRLRQFLHTLVVHKRAIIIQQKQASLASFIISKQLCRVQLVETVIFLRGCSSLHYVQQVLD